MIHKLTVATLLFATLCLTLPAKADPKGYQYRKLQFKRYTRLSALQKMEEDSREGIFKQRINHRNPFDRRTFKQRYFLNSTYAKGPNAPVLFVLCGEGTCSEGWFMGAVSDWARELKAHMVALEHRYYGKSQPFAKLTTRNLRYLSTPSALADAASFEKFAIKHLGLKGKWIVIGGSYSGSLAAYYRQKYPKAVVGALASSGPVEAHANFEQYDETVSHAVGKDCGDLMRKAVSEIEAALENPDKIAKIKKLFDASDVKDNVDFLYVAADMGATAAQYGYRDQFCSTLASASSPLKGYAEAGKKMFELFGMTAVQDTPEGAKSLDPNDYMDFASRQWNYQVCTEYGYYQIAYHDPAISVRSSLINRAYHDRMCQRIFGIKRPVNTKRINRHFYHPLFKSKTSHILFTNGALDPWARLSITKERGNNVNPYTDTFTIGGGSHCEDLGPRSTPEINQARKLFLKLAAEWLK